MKDFNLFSVIGGTVGGVLAFMFGGFDLILYALIALVALDYVTGVAKGFYTKTISSEIGYKGLIKKVIIFIVVAVAVILQRVLGDAIPLREVTITFFICNEGISILENAAEFIPIPQKLKDVLLQLRSSDNNDDEEKGGGDMTLEQFIGYYKVGQSYAYNGSYKGECVSLVKLYIEQVLGAAPQAIGNAKMYWLSRNGKYIKSIFKPIANTPDFVPQRGDVFVRTSGLYGHIGIVISATKSSFYTIEQNYNGCRVVKNITHTDWSSINFLRPLNQEGINSKSKTVFAKPKVWKNGSTPETVFADTAKKTKVGTLGKYETADCYAKANGMFLVSYKVDGTSDNKCGFVSYNGGC